MFAPVTMPRFKKCVRRRHHSESALLVCPPAVVWLPYEQVVANVAPALPRGLEKGDPSDERDEVCASACKRPLQICTRTRDL